VALARQIEDREDLAGSLYTLGLAQMAMGNHDRAAGLLEESQSLFQELGDKQLVAETVRHRGHVAARQGDYPLASALLEEAIALYRETGSTEGIAYSLRHLGVVRHYQHDYTQAVELLEKSLALFRDLKVIEGTAYALTGLGSTLHHVGNHERARRLYEESLTLSRDFGIKWAILECLYGVASVIASQGLPERAARLFGAAEVLRDGIDYSLPLPDQADNEDAVTAIHAALDDKTFAAAWAEGRAMTLEQAVEYALSSKGGGVRKLRDAEDIEVGKSPGPLAPREREVAALVAQGLTNQEIASLLVITERTAETHVQHILNKLGFNTRAQIAAWAVENGLHRSSPR
jgi:DNA-binding CsgD family transcriptional regulator